MKGRIQSFRQALVSGTFRDILTYFGPSTRDNSGLHCSLTATLDDLEPKNLEPTNHFVRDETDKRAKIPVIVRSLDDRESLLLPLEWIIVDAI